MRDYLVAQYNDPSASARIRHQIWAVLDAALTGPERDKQGLKAPSPLCSSCHGTGNGTLYLDRRKKHGERIDCPICAGQGYYLYQPPARHQEKEAIIVHFVDEVDLPDDYDESKPIMLLREKKTGNNVEVAVPHRFVTRHAEGWARLFDTHGWHAPVPTGSDALNALLRPGLDMGQVLCSIDPIDIAFAWFEIHGGVDLWPQTHESAPPAK